MQMQIEKKKKARIWRLDLSWLRQKHETISSKVCVTSNQARAARLKKKGEKREKKEKQRPPCIATVLACVSEVNSPHQIIQISVPVRQVHALRTPMFQLL